MKEKKKFVSPEAEIIELFGDIDTIMLSAAVAEIGDGENEEIYTK